MDITLEEGQRQQAAAVSLDQAATQDASVSMNVSDVREDLGNTLDSMNSTMAAYSKEMQNEIDNNYTSNSPQDLAAQNASTALDDSINAARSAADAFMKQMEGDMKAANDVDQQREVATRTDAGLEATLRFMQDVEEIRRQASVQVNANENVLETLNAAADAFRNCAKQLEEALKRSSQDAERDQSQNKDDDRYLEPTYNPRVYDTEDGGKRYEMSIEATLRHDEEKLRPRDNPEMKKLDADLRRLYEGTGRDATHGLADKFGPVPDARNLAEFNHTINRSEMAKWDNETSRRVAGDPEAGKAGEDQAVKAAIIFKADEKGQPEKSPIAMRAEREGVTTGDREQIYFGNFSSNLSRTADQAQAEDRKMSKEERKNATQADKSLREQNEDAIREFLEQQRAAAGKEGSQPDLRLVQSDDVTQREQQEQASDLRYQEEHERTLSEERQRSEDREHERDEQRAIEEQRSVEDRDDLRDGERQRSKDYDRERDNRSQQVEVHEEQRRREEREEQRRREDREEQQRREREEERRRRDEERDL